MPMTWGGGHLMRDEQPELTFRCSGRRVLVIVARNGRHYAVTGRTKTYDDPPIIAQSGSGHARIECAIHGEHVVNVDRIRNLLGGRRRDYDVAQILHTDQEHDAPTLQNESRKPIKASPGW